MIDAIFKHSEQEAQIAGSLRSELYAQARLSWGMNFLLLILGFCALQSLSFNMALSVWAGVGALIFLLRLPSVVSASRADSQSVSKTFYLFGLALSGLVWGAFAAISLPVQAEVLQLTVIALPMLVCMVSLMTLSSWLPAFHAFIWPLAVPYLATLALHSDGAYQSMLPVAACFFGFSIMFSFAINKHARLRAMMQIQNNVYVRELSTQNIQFNRARVKAETALDEMRLLNKKDSKKGKQATTRHEADDTPAEDELAFLDDELTSEDAEQTLRMSVAS